MAKTLSRKAHSSKWRADSRPNSQEGHAKDRGPSHRIRGAGSRACRMFYGAFLLGAEGNGHTSRQAAILAVAARANEHDPPGRNGLSGKLYARLVGSQSSLRRASDAESGIDVPCSDKRTTSVFR